MRRAESWVLAAALVAALLGCGRKGDPLPPIIEVPETTTDLTVSQIEQEAVLSWTYPRLTRAGRALVDLARVEVWRLEVPPGQEQTTAGPQGDALRRQLMLGRGKLVIRLEGELLAQATRGSTLLFADPLAPVTGASTPSSFWYAVRSRRRDGTASALSNIVTLQQHPVPPAVVGLTGVAGAGGIALSWQPQAGATYILERRDVTGGGFEVITPAGLAEPAWTDTTASQQHTFRYRARVVQGGVRSAASGETEVGYPDIYPPRPVDAFLCLPEPAAVRLRWDASSEPGVVYKVFRRAASATIWEHLEEALAGTELTDSTPPREEVQYAVKAVDAVGNQSDAAVCTVRVGQ